MAPRPPMPLAEARQRIQDMLQALESKESPGFSRNSIDSSVKMIEAERINKDGQIANEDEVKKGKFNGRVKFRMRCTESMANQMGNIHGGCVATIVDNMSSLAVYLHVADLEPTTPWCFLGVTQSLQVIYLAGVPVDEWMEIEVNVMNLGSRIVALSCDIWLLDSEDGVRVKKTASGTHTKVDNSFASKL